MIRRPPRSTLFPLHDALPILRRHRIPRQRLRDGFPQEAADEALHLHAHPLLAAWGRQGRDFIALLDGYDDAAARSRHADLLAGAGQRIDCFEAADGGTLLAQLQDDIRDLRPLAETQALWPPLAPDDRSIVFHVAHGAQREVEIIGR